MPLANDRINLPIPNPALRIYLHRAVIDTYPASDLPAVRFTIATLVTLSAVPSEVSEQIAISRLIDPHMQIDMLATQ
ncbi:hypothetical protein FHS09_004530 [Microbulbifer rhizosphaerae]|uniref:Uncharacterized protein n=1 Tax=Microbulbifer rhizosphaerae TaxID=1562603 RepID=A0A7W4WG74_9GAMM|nr:hypothetical protein [Microbulbifer rhizosphaerae]